VGHRRITAAIASGSAALDECLDERAERQHGQPSLPGVFQGESNQPVGEPAALETLVDLGVDECDKSRARAVGGEADDLAVD
jgi:hypothetical protein